MKLRTLTSLVAVGAVAMIGFSSPAFAVAGNGSSPTQNYMQVGPEISPETEGKLTVHKYESPAGDPELPNNGVAIVPAPDLNPLNGVQFTVTPITGIDLLTNAGWVQAAAWASNPASIPATNLDHDNDMVETTSGVGTAVFNDLPLGAYLVSETGLGVNNIIIPSEPFVITIPLPTTVDGIETWITDVHVYPKNMVSLVSKEVSDTSAHSLGDEVSWTIGAKIPGTHGSESINSFVLSDGLDPRLMYVANSAEASFNPLDPDDTVHTLVEGVDFEVNVVPSANPPGGEQLTFTLLAPALSDLADFAGGEFAVTFKSKVIAVGDGTIMNTPVANINGHEFTSTPVSTLWGVVDIFKFEQGTDPKLGLEGATFQVFTAATGGSPLAFLTLVDDGEGGFTEVWVTDFTTDANGHVIIPGLHVGVDYWVEETVAPVRFQKLTDRVQITGLAASNGIESPLLLEVPNIKVPDWQLPLTGGSGLLIPMLGFALLAVSAGTASLISRKKSSLL